MKPLIFGIFGALGFDGVFHPPRALTAIGG